MSKEKKQPKTKITETIKKVKIQQNIENSIHLSNYFEIISEIGFSTYPYHLVGNSSKEKEGNCCQIL